MRELKGGWSAIEVVNESLSEALAEASVAVARTEERNVNGEIYSNRGATRIYHTEVVEAPDGDYHQILIIFEGE